METPAIVRMETWVCRRPTLQSGTYGVDDRLGGSMLAECIVLRLTSEDGVSGLATVLSGRDTRIPLGLLQSVVAPLVLGRSAHHRESIWQDLVKWNRRLTFFPMYLPGPVDVALWDLAAKTTGLPLYQCLGGYRDSMPYYASSSVFATPDEYLGDVARYVALGATAYKIHPSGGWRRHIEIAEAVRAAYPGLVLMLDVAGSDYTLPQAVRVGRALERLDFDWFEEPFDESHVGAYVDLARTLDIAVAATEAVYGGPSGVAEFIRVGAADIVRADVSWRWGITGTMKTMHVAEAFGLSCELHTTMMGPMDIANLHVACAARNSEYFELLVPHEAWAFPMREPYPIDSAGLIHVPSGPGLGVEIDWDAVDDETLWKGEWSA
jgi:L-alanine-DL-glutamate epimerase-like enolase superfamily enzyme